MRLVLFFTRAFAHRFASGRQRGRRACSVCVGRFLPPPPSPSQALCCGLRGGRAAWLNFAKVGRRNQRGNDEDRLALSSGGTAGRRPKSAGRRSPPLPPALAAADESTPPLALSIRPRLIVTPSRCQFDVQEKKPYREGLFAPLPEKCCCCLLAQALASSWRSSQCSALILLRHCV